VLDNEEALFRMGGTESKPQEECITIAVAPPPSTAPLNGKKAASGLNDSKQQTASKSAPFKAPQQQPPPSSGRSTAPVSSLSALPTVTIAEAKKSRGALDAALPAISLQSKQISAPQPPPGKTNHALPVKSKATHDDTTFDDVESFDLDDDEEDRETSPHPIPHTLRNEGDMEVTSPDSAKSATAARVGGTPLDKEGTEKVPASSMSAEGTVTATTKKPPAVNAPVTAAKVPPAAPAPAKAVAPAKKSEKNLSTSSTQAPKGALISPPSQPSSVTNPLSTTANKGGAKQGTPSPSTAVATPATSVKPKPVVATVSNGSTTATAANKTLPVQSPPPLVSPSESRPHTSLAQVASPQSPRIDAASSNEVPLPSQHQPMRRATTQAYIGHSIDSSHDAESSHYPSDIGRRIPPPLNSKDQSPSTSTAAGGGGWIPPFGEGASPGRSALRTSFSFADDTHGGGGPVGSSATRTSVTSLLSSSDPKDGWRLHNAQAIGGTAQPQPQPPTYGKPSHNATAGRSVALLEFSSTNVGPGASTSVLHHSTAQRKQAKTGRVRLPSTFGDDDGDGADVVYSRNISSPTTMSMASGVSRASSIASFRFRSAIPFDFLDDKKLRRDFPTEVVLRRAAEDALLSIKKRKLSVAALESRHNSLANKPQSSSVPHPPPAPPPPPHATTVGVSIVPLPAGTDIRGCSSTSPMKQRGKDNVFEDEDMHHLFPLAPADDLRGPVLVIGDCGDDIVAIVMILATMEAYCVEEHNKLLSNLYSYVLASGTGLYIALALSQGETMNQLLELLMQHDASLLRPPKPPKKKEIPPPPAPLNTQGKLSSKHATTKPATSSTPRQSKPTPPAYLDAFYDDGADAIDTLLRLKFAEGEQILDHKGIRSTSGRTLAHRYRRGDYSVSRPCLFVSNEAADAIRVVDWNAEDYSIAAMYAVAANCKMTAPAPSTCLPGSDTATRRPANTISSTSAPPEPKMVSLLAEKFLDPLLFVLTMTPRPTAVCRISLPPADHEDVHTTELRSKRQELLAKEFRSDFIDIVLPEFIDLPPRATGDEGAAAQSTSGGGGGQIPRKSSFSRYQRSSIGSSCSISAQGLPTDPNAGNLSCLTVGLDAFTPMEDLLQEWNLEGAGKERRLAVIQQTEVFIEDIEGSLQRAMDYMVAKAPKAMQAAPTTATMMLDELLSMPNIVQQ
jgi:hypothetical protein